MAETLMKKHQCLVFLDTTKGGEGTPVWARIDKSTMLALALNPQTETFDYICDELPTKVLDRYEPSLPEEIATYEGNACYDFVFKEMYELPVGGECNVPCLICFPGTGKKAWKFDTCTLSISEFNAVDKKISFTLELGGSPVRGTYTVDAQTGKPTFTPGT